MDATPYEWVNGQVWHLHLAIDDALGIITGAWFDTQETMKNGQLKPAYNIQYGTDSEFVTWATVSPQPTETTTLIPFLQEMERYTNKRYRNVVADAGYESEENYLYLETNQQRSFIKPNNYEKSKTPLEERTKNIEVSKRFQRQRQEDLERITSPEGIQLRVNRSIQAEGAFAMVKADMTFRRFLTRGNKNVLVETMLLAMVYNIQKLHCKIQAEKLNRHRIPVDNTA